MEKLYGFNNHKKVTFLKLSFKNETAFNKAKKLWYTENKNYKKTKLKKKAYCLTLQMITCIFTKQHCLLF